MAAHFKTNLGCASSICVSVGGLGCIHSTECIYTKHAEALVNFKSIHVSCIILSITVIWCSRKGLNEISQSPGVTTCMSNSCRNIGKSIHS